jgi:hypothetical protein
MLLLAYLMTQSEAWKRVRIRVFAACFAPETNETVDDIRKILEEVRIDAEPEVVIKPNSDAVAAYSSDASLVFLPFRFRGNQPLDPFGEHPEAILSRLLNVAIVLAAEDIDLNAEPEEGTAGEIAAALDALADTRQRADEAEKSAIELSEMADKKLQEMREAALSKMNEKEFSVLKAEAFEAKEKAIRAARKAAKASAKAEAAANAAETAGARLPDSEKESDETE